MHSCCEIQNKLNRSCKKRIAYLPGVWQNKVKHQVLHLKGSKPQINERKHAVIASKSSILVKMEKIRYEEATVEIISFAAADIIRTSGTDPFPGQIVDFEEVPLP